MCGDLLEKWESLSPNYWGDSRSSDPIQINRLPRTSC